MTSLQHRTPNNGNKSRKLILIQHDFVLKQVSQYAIKYTSDLYYMTYEYGILATFQHLTLFKHVAMLSHFLTKRHSQARWGCGSAPTWTNFQLLGYVKQWPLNYPFNFGFCLFKVFCHFLPWSITIKPLFGRICQRICFTFSRHLKQIQDYTFWRLKRGKPMVTFEGFLLIVHGFVLVIHDVFCKHVLQQPKKSTWSQ